MSEDTLPQPQFDFGTGLQKRLLSLMLWNSNFLMQAQKFLQPYYFSTEELKWICEQIFEHFTKYRVPMDDDAMAEKIKRLPLEDQLPRTRLAVDIYNMRVNEDIYLKDALLEFVKRHLFIRGWKSIASAYNTGDSENAYARFNEINTSIKEVAFDPPDRSFLFGEYDRRWEQREARRLSRDVNTFPTAIPMLDQVLQGGLKKGEVGLIYADAKMGKSIGLCHMGFSCVRTRSGRVCHFVLEGGRDQTEDRYDSRFAEHNYYMIKNGLIPSDKDKRLRYEYRTMTDSMVVQGMVDKWDYTVEDLDAKLRELESLGFVADMLVVDYGDLLEPRKSTENKYASQEASFRDLKLLASKAYRGRGVAIWTASQIQRPKRRGKVEHPADVDENFVWTSAEIADSYAKIRIVDLAMSLNQTAKEREAGRMRLYISDARDYEAKITVPVRCDFTRMIFHTNKELDKESNADFVNQLSEDSFADQ